MKRAETPGRSGLPVSWRYRSTADTRSSGADSAVDLLWDPGETDTH